MAKSILVADDSPTIRKVVELTFSDSEFHVESVDSGVAAVRSLASLQPDLVLADAVMPEPSGYEICRQVKASERPVPVLLLTGAFESFDRERAQACGADGYLTKPFDSEVLFERIQALLARAEAGLGADPAGGSAGRRAAGGLRPEEIDAIARAVVERLSGDLLREVAREVAREVLPEVAQRLVLERIRELEEEQD